MTREELIQELKLMDDGDIEPTYDRIADFILSRERLLLEKIGKPLRKFHKIWADQPDRIRHWGNGDCDGSWKAIDSALAIIEKEKSNNKEN